MFTLARSALSVGSTRRPLSPELRTTTPPHRAPGTQLAGFTHLPAKCISTRSGPLHPRDTASCPAGHTAALLAVTSMSKSQPSAWLIGLPWPPAPDRAHQLRPSTLCLPSVVSGSIRRVAPQLRRTDPTLPQRVYHPHRHTGVATARRRHLHVGDHLHGVLLFARLRHLHLVTSGSCGVCIELDRTSFASFSAIGTLPSSASSIGTGTTVPVPAHVALLPQKPLQQSVLLHLCHRSPTEPIHQPVHVSRTHRQPATPLT